MIYYLVEMIVGQKRGFLGKQSKELLNETWMKAVYFESYDMASECGDDACFTARKIYPRAKNVGYRILASKVIPARADIIKAND